MGSVQRLYVEKRNTAKLKLNALGYNWAILLLGEINRGI
jgi:hypothetical protein